MYDIYIYIYIILACILVYLIYSNYNINVITNENSIDQCFYDYLKVYPELKILKSNRSIIMEEMLSNIKKSSMSFDKNWIPWPEKNLYTEDMDWKIIPFYGFNIWVKKNCNKYPKLYNVLKNIKGLRTAIISKLGKKTVLNKHQGWAKLSNNVLRVQYGLIVPKECYLGVSDLPGIEEKRMVNNDDIIVFDDSKLHWAENNSDQDRIVLILDIDRPNYIKKGKSTVIETPELLNFINKFKSA
jgi:aspartyl/asparaginyl beta-hydroxylase (cupin superfamily)